MPENLDLKKITDRREAEAWIGQFIAVYGHGAATVFSERRLNGVSLVRVLQALELGTVTKATQTGKTTIDCRVEYQEEKDSDSVAVITVVVSALINLLPPKLVIDFVEEKEKASGTDHAA